MAAGPSIDVSGWLEEQLAQASPDLLWAMVKTFAEALMAAEADAVRGAGYRERSNDRVNSRNSYRAREWDTRAGRVVAVHALIATGVNADGHHEVIGLFTIRGVVGV
jgi:transposase-like protein